MIKREAMSQIGLLDERFYIYLEEVDWCFRLTQNGWKNYFIPDAEVIHFGGQSSQNNLDARIVHRYKSLLIFYFKHFSAFDRLILRALLLFEISWRWTVLAIFGMSSLRAQPKREIAKRYREVVHLALSYSPHA